MSVMNKIENFFCSEEYCNDSENATLSFTPDELREICNIIIDRCRYSHEKEKYLKDCEELAFRVAELEITNEWIPVSENLPKEWVSVLVCFKSQGGLAQAVSERINKDGIDVWSGLGGIEPVAWMFLPKSYQKGGK